MCTIKTAPHSSAVPMAAILVFTSACLVRFTHGTVCVDETCSSSYHLCSESKLKHRDVPCSGCILVCKEANIALQVLICKQRLSASLARSMPSIPVEPSASENMTPMRGALKEVIDAAKDMGLSNVLISEILQKICQTGKVLCRSACPLPIGCKTICNTLFQQFRKILR